MDDFEDPTVRKLRGRSISKVLIKESKMRVDFKTDFDVLDHGYLKLIDSWGRDELDNQVGDEAIIAAARMSTGKGFLGWGVEETCDRCKGKTYFVAGGDSDRDDDLSQPCPECRGKGTHTNKPGDEKLLRYLYENKHATPFEMAGMTIEVKAPIMVFREWHRHRTQSYNEMSARYTPLPDENYIPTVERLMMNSKANKQAGAVKDAEELTVEVAESYRKTLSRMYVDDQAFYETALRQGIPKELARVHLPVGRYSRMRASANLRNWLAFLTLRMDSKAQWEIRQYANLVGEIIRVKFPRTWGLFAEKNR